MNDFIDIIYHRSPVWVQNILVSAYGYSLFRKRYSGIFRDIESKLQLFSSLKPDDIDRYQNEQLCKMVEYCLENIPFYKRLFADYGFNKDSITSVDDLKKLPILEKNTVRKNSDLFRPSSGAAPYFTQHTSGSTGTPLIIDLDEMTYKLAMALLVNHERNHGINFGDRKATFAGRMIQRPEVSKPPFSRFNKSENQRIFSSYHLSSRNFQWYRKQLSEFKPVEIIGYPSAICELANLYREADVKPDYPVKAVITNSETLLSWQRETIESVFDSKVFDYYGTAEYLVFAGQSTDGLYYSNPMLGITEVISERKNNPEGKIIASTLTNTAMPLIRYDTGDTAETAYDSSSSQGSPVLRSIVGRKDDFIETKDGRRIGRIDHIFKGVTGLIEAQVIQEKPGQAVIRLVTDSPGGFDESVIVRNLQNRVGKDFQIQLVYVDRIARGANGKFKSVVRV